MRTPPRHLFHRQPAPDLGALPCPHADPSAHRARLMLDAFAARPDKRCVVCDGTDAPIVALWEPLDDHTQRRLGARPGQRRVVYYALCQRCYEHATPEGLNHCLMRMADVLLQPEGVN